MVGDNHKGETLYLWKTSSGEVWKGFGDKDTHTVFNGEVKDGIPNGLGVLIYPYGGWKYVGEFKGGKYHGRGKLTNKNGRKYIGGWKNGKKHGQGTLNFGKGGIEEFNGMIYEGEWKDGRTDGHGIQTWKDGRKYVGGWKNSEFHGKGKFVNPPRGLKYEGEYNYGSHHGQGTFTWSNGNKFVGEYKYGEWWNGEKYDKDGKVYEKYVNGVKQ